MNYELVHFKMWELNFELVHVESELSQHCRHREIMLYKPAN